MSSYNGVPVPSDGARIDFINDKFEFPTTHVVREGALPAL